MLGWKGQEGRISLYDNAKACPEAGRRAKARERGQKVKRRKPAMRRGKRRQRTRGRGLVSSLGIILWLIIPVFLVPPAMPPSRAATLEEKQREAERIRARIKALEEESRRLADEYNAVLTEYEVVRTQAEENRRQLEKAQKDYLRARDLLQRRIRSMYMEGETSTLEVFLESTSLDDLLSRYNFFSSIGIRDRRIMMEAKRLRDEIQQRQAELERQKRRQEELLAELGAKRASLEASLQEQQKLLDSVSQEILQLVAQMAAGETGRSVSIKDFIFPVAGPCTFSNDWHAPRRGHLHQGNDIFAPMGTPCVACVSGTVTQLQGGNAGLYIRLSGDDGNVYYYMHLQRFGASGHVSAGTVIGYVGDTGNAQGGPPHLHFEIRPGGGSPINPYPILLAAYRVYTR